MFPRFVQVEQRLADRSIPDVAGRIRQELAAGFAGRVRPGARIAIGAGSRGISNIATIAKTVVDFWKDCGAQPFIFPAMGSHGAATAEGQAECWPTLAFTRRRWAFPCLVRSMWCRWAGHRKGWKPGRGYLLPNSQCAGAGTLPGERKPRGEPGAGG